MGVLGRGLWLAAGMGLALLLPASAGAFTIRVVGPDGADVGGFRWLVEEDATHHVEAGVPDPDTLGVSFHRSYMPVIASGDSTSASVTVDPSKHYFVSALPQAGFALGGAAVAPGQTSVQITVQPLPLPTAQITVLVFEDNRPINNAPDLPQEVGLEGFSLILAEAGGRYGMSGGQVMQDAFGNPLGTTYLVDPAGDPILDAEGMPQMLMMGSGVIKTDVNGEATIKYLSPGKYGVQAVAPNGSGWVQTATIEGTKTVDAWVKPKEPAFFAEFGPPGYHVFIGFVRPTEDQTRLTGSSTITGKVVNMHLSRPPDYAFYDGAPFGHTTPWVGLNDLAAGQGEGIYAQRCNPDGSFSIPNVPAGSYQLVVWDDNLDLIFAFLGVSVPGAGAPVTLGDVPVFQWFSRLGTFVFNDVNQNGFWDSGERGIPNVPVNIRWRDGTLYQSVPTDGEGYAPFDEVFPFFSWQVVEVDSSRFKATGATVVVDTGGPIDPTDPWSFEGQLNPQLQGGSPYRVQTGPVLTQAFQGMIGQLSVVQWGKAAYAPGENGGISGFVSYGTTRAENDPGLAATEPWEPGIPRVQVNLYRDSNFDGAIDDLDDNGSVTLADVDNHPFGWRTGGTKGAEDVDHDADGAFDQGDAVQITVTDSWDDALPTGCPGDPTDPFFRGGRCHDGLRNFNQVRPGVYDGKYSFQGTAAGGYVVEVVPPRSAYGAAYRIAKEEDRNVDFGDSYVPSPLALTAPCVGEAHLVPPVLSLFPDAAVPAGFAGQTRPLCDRKQVFLSSGLNAVANFTLYTEVPVAAHIVGFVLDDTANEFDPNSPQFGEKYAPPWLPISIRDWTGLEISRVYSDQWGNYNALVPSSYTMSRPFPSGVAPNMLTVCLNAPAKPDPARPGQFVADPYFNKQYSQFCYTFQHMPGVTTYLDTPVVRVAAFAGPDQFPLDCEPEAGVPAIYSVSGPGAGGPYLPATGLTLRIVSLGMTEVPNPAYDPAVGTPRTIPRDYGFGTSGAVTIGGVPLTIDSWSSGLIVARVPDGVTTGQLRVRRADTGRSTLAGVTVTIGGPTPIRVPPGGSIQQAIDFAPRNSLVLVPPGEYLEPLILWKPLKLQGWGAGSTRVNAVKVPADKLELWRQKVQDLIASGRVDLLPAQETGFGGIEPTTLFNEEGPAVLVLARDAVPARGGFGRVGGSPNARIDGFTLTGADHAGGIVVNGYAHHLVISNNRVVNNTGFFGGGIRVGHPTLTVETPGGLEYQSGFNDHVRIHHNLVLENGALGGVGGGVSLCTGSDFYRVTDNRVCGNFTLGEGAGIGHLGLSPEGLIARNTVLFNQSFNQGITVSGGGIVVAGAPPIGGVGLSPGSGSVTVEANVIQGNQAGAGEGGGIRTSRVNGEDVARSRNQPAGWHEVRILDNVIVNNVAALAGGAISLQDTARSVVAHNTIAHNDSVGTAGEAFSPGSPNQSNPQPAGIVSHAHSPQLAAVFGASRRTAPFREFSNPRLVNNIIWENRSFYFLVDRAADPPRYLLMENPPSPYWDLAVLGTAAPASLDPRSCLLTDAAGTAASNFSADPRFIAGYLNGARSSVVLPEITTAIQPAPAFDEGGNYIDVRFGPLTTVDPATSRPFGDYRIQAGSPAIGAGTSTILGDYPALSDDVQGQPRPNPVGSLPDLGADER